ncbi:MAG: glycoside hydrolase family 92 protein, partial [Bacteroidetes bacterium]|nr:glycoside hydrolase family 92 protein [Bacteroidota bacterium]
MKNIFIPLLFFVCTVSAQQGIKPLNYVDPMIGTGGHGHTFPGATVPFGMVQLAPDTRIDGSWDGCSGYHYSDSIIHGFSHTHLSGTGCSDFGDIVLFPTTENIKPSDLLEHKFTSTFKHKNEKASAGYYSVGLDNGVKVELTAATRVGFHKYTFPKSEYAYIILDLELRDKVLGAAVVIRDNKKVVGYRQSEAWAKNQIVMYDLEFSEPFIDASDFSGSVMEQKEPVSGTKVRVCFKFKMPPNNVIMTKVALSPVTIEGAEKNMAAECPHWDFEKTKKEAENYWNKELSKIEVTSSDEDKLKVFYTALYHTMIQPNVAMDVDGSYTGRDGKTHKAVGFTYYSVFSLWDTFRAAHPLYTIIDQKRTADFINTFLAQYEQSGRLPVWELASNETDCMIGYHAVSVIADAMVKGIKEFDYEKAFAASKHSAMLDHFGLKAYKEKGFISMEDEHESVSKTVDYSYDDWCIAQMAKRLGKTGDYSYFMKRSQSWKNVFDPETGFMRPKKNGGWLTPFEPREVNNNFTEGNSWQYTFFVPHDIYGLKVMLGEGNDRYSGQKLIELFEADSKTTGREQADITGLIGQYAHGNEPSHHMAYLYNYWFMPSKTQERVRQIITDFYKPIPDGLIGNEDCGQMSAWYVLSSIGFYSICPGNTYYSIGTPSFKKVVFNLENNKRII